MHKLFTYVISLALFGLMSVAMAENATEVDGYTIHHNALTTDSLTPGVADAYNIQRSKNRGMLTISVLKKPNNEPVKAAIVAHATNLNGQMREITLHEINEGGAIYYIGDFRIANEETLNFDLEVTPAGVDHPYKATLSQEFVTQ